MSNLHRATGRSLRPFLIGLVVSLSLPSAAATVGEPTAAPATATGSDSSGAAATTHAVPSEHAPPEFEGYDSIGADKRGVFNASDPFNSTIHAEIIDQNPGAKRCTDILSRAQWRQDIVKALTASAHFDNCQFTESLAYMQQQLNQADKEAVAGDPARALAALGRALHGVQDFYSHTNYVELMAQRHARFEDVPMLPLWTTEGRQRLQALVGEGLVSGKVFWESGDLCDASVPAHSTLAKDSAATERGKQPVARWHMTHYRAARELAEQATRAFLRNSLKKAGWQSVREHCSNLVGYLIVFDRRSP